MDREFTKLFTVLRALQKEYPTKLARCVYHEDDQKVHCIINRRNREFAVKGKDSLELINEIVEEMMG